ncbi:hypothetical protein ACFTAO_44100 [Paenibacillus rhizoplanae]
MHQFFLPDSLNSSLHELFDRGQIPQDSSYYVFNPVALDDSAAPPGQSVLYFLVPVPAVPDQKWEEIAGALADKVMADAEKRGFPGLAASVIWRRLRTPADAEQEGMYGGGQLRYCTAADPVGGYSGPSRSLIRSRGCMPQALPSIPAAVCRLSCRVRSLPFRK